MHIRNGKLSELCSVGVDAMAKIAEIVGKKVLQGWRFPFS
jgi:hypothetical protein